MKLADLILESDEQQLGAELAAAAGGVAKAIS